MIIGAKLEEILTETEKRLEFVRKALGDCPPGSLLQIKEKGKLVYYHDVWIGGKRRRFSLHKHPKMVSLLARKKYLQLEERELENNISALRKALSGFYDITPEHILQQLPEKYKGLPKEVFFQGEMETMQSKWAKEPYRQSNYMPEGKVHLTSRGLAVRSKSEVLIIEKLYEFDLPLRYEQIMHINGYDIAPDLTIMGRCGIEFIWEHCGLTGNPKYMKKHKWKMEMYESVGIVPWRNLIVTYDNEQGYIDLAVIESEIRNKLL